jgi:hypothetical protein
MAKTLVEKVDSPDLNVTIFKISGTLGFHENKVLTKFFGECSSRKIVKLIIDFSDLGSLGGGCAAIIREAAEESVQFCIAGASRTVQNFLEKKGPTSILFVRDIETGLAELGKAETTSVCPQPTRADERRASAAEAPHVRRSDRPTDAPTSPTRTSAAEADGLLEDVMVEVDSLLGKGRAAAPCAVEMPVRNTPAETPREAPVAPSPKKPVETVSDRPSSGEITALKRKIVQYRALFSLNSDFSQIEDKARLLDAFLLTTIAQVGVESAAFLELTEDVFAAACWKGFETADPGSLNISRDEVDMNTWLESSKIFPLPESPIADSARSRIEKWDLLYASPFIVHGRFRGIVLLGKAIRRDLDADSWEFLSMMFNQVAIAYENSCRLEEQSERTLGLVQELISMIESNTLSRETTERVMDLTYATAVKMHYPEEHIRDLLYGTVLRDIGMIKTSNLILRSPRELVQEEWDIIKQHPAEGAEMLRKMGFSTHTQDIVLGHHERYNGEGYPEGLSGSQIPLGARILSVVESYAAMLQDRPQRPALTQEETLSTLKENWGLRYDPDVVNEFVELIEDEIRTKERVKYKGIELIKQ